MLWTPLTPSRSALAKLLMDALMRETYSELREDGGEDAPTANPAG